MVVRVLVAVAMTTAVSSSAALSASPLHEIATTPGPSLVCGNVVVHANAAIAATLHADDAIARSRTLLQTVDFDTLGETRKRALNDMISAATEIAQYAEHGKAETARLRAFMNRPAGDDRSADLGAFATQLDAALDRQREIGRTVDEFAKGVIFRTLSRSGTIGNADASDGAVLHASGSPPSALALVDATRSNDTSLARTTANEVSGHITEIDADEARAATHSEPAIGGC